MSVDPYDDLGLDAAPFRPEEPGATLEIRVTEIRRIQTKGTKDAPPKPGALVAGNDDTKRDWEWVAWNRRSKAELQRERPMPGDRLRIVYEGRDANASNPAIAARLFRLEVLERAALMARGVKDRVRTGDGAEGPLVDFTAIHEEERS